MSTDVENSSVVALVDVSELLSRREFFLDGRILEELETVGVVGALGGLRTRDLVIWREHWQG